MFFYIVQPGDYLYRIADYFNVSVASILAANPGLNPNNLFVGQRIRIPISRSLYQSYPWYYLYPYLFMRYPRRYWDDRRRWPRRRRDRDRRYRDGWYQDGWQDRDNWRNRSWQGGDGMLNPNNLQDMENMDEWQEADDFWDMYEDTDMMMNEQDMEP